MAKKCGTFFARVVLAAMVAMFPCWTARGESRPAAPATRPTLPARMKPAGTRASDEVSPALLQLAQLATAHGFSDEQRDDLISRTSHIVDLNRIRDVTELNEPFANFVSQYPLKDASYGDQYRLWLSYCICDWASRHTKPVPDDFLPSYHLAYSAIASEMKQMFKVRLGESRYLQWNEAVVSGTQQVVEAIDKRTKMLIADPLFPAFKCKLNDAIRGKLEKFYREEQIYPQYEAAPTLMVTSDELYRNNLEDFFRNEAVHILFVISTQQVRPLNQYWPGTTMWSAQSSDGHWPLFAALRIQEALPGAKKQD